jgi:MFS family permease
MAVGLVLPVVYPHILTILIAGICVGGTFMIITMAGIQEAHKIAPNDDVMRHIAIMTAAFASGQIIGPLFAGIIYRHTESFSLSLLATSVILVITAWSLLGGNPAYGLPKP